MLCSAGYHTFACQSELASRKWLSLDLTVVVTCQVLTMPSTAIKWVLDPCVYMCMFVYVCMRVCVCVCVCVPACMHVGWDV